MRVAADATTVAPGTHPHQVAEVEPQLAPHWWFRPVGKASDHGNRHLFHAAGKRYFPTYPLIESVRNHDQCFKGFRRMMWIGTRRRKARIGLLVVALGALLWGTATLVAGPSCGRWLIGLVLAGLLTALIACAVFDALRTDIFPLKGRAVSRDHQPLAYWVIVGWFAVCGALLGAVSVWSGAELMAATLARP